MELALAARFARSGISRRGLLRGSGRLAAFGLAASSAVPFASLVGKSAAARVPFSADYGPLVETADEATGLPLLKLPRGFRYISYGWTGDPLEDGTPTPSAHDGMGVVIANRHHVVLVRNHEQGSDSPSFASEQQTFDPMANGGTTNLVFDLKRGRWLRSWTSLSGTVRNCAGGITSWGSWLTCEETLAGPSSDNEFTKPHGWVFDVPGLGARSHRPGFEAAGFHPGEHGARPVALTGLGRMSHEAVAVDPETGIVYETEDAGPCGFYRFLPRRYGKLARGGKLQMLRVVGRDNADLTGTSLEINPGTTFDVDWVDIDDPETNGGVSVHEQGANRGGAFFTRLEGCWHDGGWIFFVSTDGGVAEEGQIWQYEPQAKRLTLIYVSPGKAVLNNPDNITVSPRGGIILCEDGGGGLDLGFGERLLGLTLKGEIFPFAENNIVLNGEKGFTGDFRSREWAGATFSPDGRWLFVNIQTPGVTFAITGPWRKGAL